jgi:hypothetical protein
MTGLGTGRGAAPPSSPRHHRRSFRKTHHTAAIACLTAPISLTYHSRLT